MFKDNFISESKLYYLKRVKSS